MGILTGLFKSRDKPSNRTNGSAYSFLMGGSSSGRRVNERSAIILTNEWFEVLFRPKGSDISFYRAEEIKTIEFRLHATSRRIFQGLSTGNGQNRLQIV